MRSVRVLGLLGIGLAAAAGFAACSSNDAASAGNDGGIDSAIDASGQDSSDAGQGEGAEDQNVAHVFSAGTRLRPIWLEAEGGIKQFLGFRDTALDTDCMFRLAEDGSLRCLPAAIPLHRTGVAGYGELLSYRDDVCGQPVAASSNCPAKFATGYPLMDAGCPHGQHTAVRPLGAFQDAGGSPYYLRGEDGGCVQTGTMSGSVAPLGDVSPPSAFVAGRYEKGAPNGRVAPRFVVADDGARVFDGFVDQETNVACQFTIAPDGQARCMPSDMLSGQYPALFADDHCTRPAIAGDPGCSPPAFGALRDMSGCDRVLRYVKVGAPLGASYYVLGPDGPTDCRQVPLAAGQLFDTVEVPVTTFYAASGTAIEGTARLKEVVAQLPGGTTVTVSLLDSSRNEACSFGGGRQAVTTDGLVRCLPKAEYFKVSGLSTNSQCDGGAAIGQRCSDGGSAYAYGLREGCPLQEPIYEVVDTPLSQVWHPSGESCSGPTSPNDRVRGVNAELAPSAFVPADVHVAP